MRNIDEINNYFIALWNQNFSASLDLYAPMQYKEPKVGCIMFIGMNPSFSKKGFKKILKGTDKENLNVSEFYKWPISKTFNIDCAHRIETWSLERHDFFAPHRTLAESLSKDWDHLDLFAYRETNQNKIKPLIIEKGSKHKLNEFGSKQFELFLEILNLAKPSAIVVVNAFASNIYLQQRKLIFNRELGYHEESLCSEKKIPIFFSGMITGGQSLDTFSRERLFWQIEKAVNG